MLSSFNVTIRYRLKWIDLLEHASAPLSLSSALGNLRADAVASKMQIAYFGYGEFSLGVRV